MFYFIPIDLNIHDTHSFSLFKIRGIPLIMRITVPDAAKSRAIVTDIGIVPAADRATHVVPIIIP